MLSLSCVMKKCLILCNFKNIRIGFIRTWINKVKKENKWNEINIDWYKYNNFHDKYTDISTTKTYKRSQ